MSFFKFQPPFAPCMGFVGHKGAGKSAMAVEIAYRAAKRTGHPIYSNIDLRFEDVEVHKIRGLPDLLAVENACILWDDISAVAPSRESMSSPPAIVTHLCQLRHVNAALLWTSLTFGDVDIKIRQGTEYLVSLKAWRTKPVTGEFYDRTLVTFGQTYDVRSPLVTDLTDKTPRINRGFRRLSRLPLDSYNTKERIEVTADHAVCMVCGLPRRKEFCKGAHSEPQTVGITSIASSSAREVPAVKPPGSITQHKLGAERVPVPDDSLGLDGLDGGQ